MQRLKNILYTENYHIKYNEINHDTNNIIGIRSCGFLIGRHLIGVLILSFLYLSHKSRNWPITYRSENCPKLSVTDSLDEPVCISTDQAGNFQKTQHTTTNKNIRLAQFRLQKSSYILQLC